MASLGVTNRRLSIVGINPTSRLLGLSVPQHNFTVSSREVSARGEDALAD